MLSTKGRIDKMFIFAGGKLRFTKIRDLNIKEMDLFIK